MLMQVSKRVRATDDPVMVSRVNSIASLHPRPPSSSLLQARVEPYVIWSTGRRCKPEGF